jgi:hypothetical protein
MPAARLTPESLRQHWHNYQEGRAPSTLPLLAEVEAAWADIARLTAERDGLAARVEARGEVVAAAANYVRCVSDGRLSPYVCENGRRGSSPWAELLDALAHLAREAEGGS